MIYSGQPDAFNPDGVVLLNEFAGRSFMRREYPACPSRASQLSVQDTIQAIVAVVEMRDPYTAGHEKRVAAPATAIGRQHGWPETRTDGLHVAGSIRDVGKVGIPRDPH